MQQEAGSLGSLPLLSSASSFAGAPSLNMTSFAQPVLASMRTLSAPVRCMRAVSASSSLTAPITFPAPVDHYARFLNEKIDPQVCHQNIPRNALMHMHMGSAVLIDYLCLAPT